MHQWHRKNILIVDDDVATLEALSIMLEDAGYRVTAVRDGSHALYMRRGSDDAPDLMMLDIRLSSADGGRICASLKSDRRTKRIPIIMFSANRDVEQVARRCGADDFLPKPFHMRDLFRKIAVLT